MDAKLYSKILRDKYILDIKKLQYKYPDVNIGELVGLLKMGIYKSIPLPDFTGNELCYMEILTKIRMRAIKLLVSPQAHGEKYGKKAIEDEISSTLAIENIDTSRDSVRRILNGYAPIDASEKQIFGLKKGIEYISNPVNDITAKNLHTLYQLAVGDYLKNEDKLMPGKYYRHDKVYLVSRKIEHTGLAYYKLPEYMGKLIDFISQKSNMNDLAKAAVIHFYIGYLHPYFDGNGRIARLVHLWFLVRNGYSATLYFPFSSHIEKNRGTYYNAFSMTEENTKITGVTDVTPFLVYFDEHIYSKLRQSEQKSKTLEIFKRELSNGNITEKEKNLWNYVLSAYGEMEFSTKQLEKDFGNAAYATIRSFVLKFEKLSLLSGQKYSNKVKYKIRS